MGTDICLGEHRSVLKIRILTVIYKTVLENLNIVIWYGNAYCSRGALAFIKIHIPDTEAFIECVLLFLEPLQLDVVVYAEKCNFRFFPI